MIHRSDTLPLSPEAAFDLFLHSIAWWPHPGTLRIVPHVGGNVTLTDDKGRPIARGTVLACDPGRYLAFRWQEPDGAETVVAISFAPDAAGCRVNLTQGTPDVLGPLADAVSTVTLSRWGRTLGALKAATGQRLPA